MTPPTEFRISSTVLGAPDLATGVEYAEARGARLAAYQPQDDVRVMIDPAGHPFCLFQLPA